MVALPGGLRESRHRVALHSAGAKRLRVDSLSGVKLKRLKKPSPAGGGWTLAGFTTYCFKSGSSVAKRVDGEEVLVPELQLTMGLGLSFVAMGSLG
ncbi:hypothetical protein [Persicitalea sp.]|uniref:hypothetical protein n=1 Tax=Persicitalea sp. TaxID=3100273 RepID=UPI003593774D